MAEGKNHDRKNQVPDDEGWQLLPRAVRMHYFRGGRSLCGGWGFFGGNFYSDAQSSNKCKACERKRAKERGHG